jgi:hypothetical protein
MVCSVTAYGVGAWHNGVLRDYGATKKDYFCEFFI